MKILKTLKRKTVLIPLLLALAVAAYFYVGSGPGQSSREVLTAVVRKGDLTITAVENGNVRAKNNMEIRSEISLESGVKILSIVPEGYLVTPEDVAQGKVLLELDPTSLEEKLITQKSDLRESEAGLTEAAENYSIQVSQNESALKLARQSARFALLDFKKYLGKGTSERILGTLKMPMDDLSFVAFEQSIMDKAQNADLSMPEAVEDKLEDPAESRGSRNRGAAMEDPVLGMGERIPALPGSRAEREDRSQNADRPRSGPPQKDGNSPELAETSSGAQTEVAGETPEEKPVELNPEAKAAIADALGGPVEGASKSETSGAKREGDTDEITLVSTGSLPSEPGSNVDFLSYLEGGDQTEEGDAAQEYRKLRDSLLVSKNELALSTENFDGSQRLFDKGFITKTSLEQEKLSLEKTRLDVKSAETALVLFRDYELPKSAEKYLADYEESLRSMERCVKENRAQLAKVEAKWITARQQHQIKEAKFTQTETELKGCVVKAVVPGLVAYGTSRERRWNDNNEAIAEGATVRYRQTILTIPDMSSMMVDVNIPEARIKLVRKNLPSVIQVDAEPDKPLRGRVSEVAVLPDSANARFTSTKVYPVSLEIEGMHQWLKPGMSAKVEVLSSQLKDVIYAPIQAVNRDGDDFVCFVPKLGGWEKRKVQIGSSSEQFIEITEGMKPGESVALSVPPGEVLRPEKRESDFDGLETPAAEEAPAFSASGPAGAEGMGAMGEGRGRRRGGDAAGAQEGGDGSERRMRRTSSGETGSGMGGPGMGGPGMGGGAPRGEGGGSRSGGRPSGGGAGGGPGAGGPPPF